MPLKKVYATLAVMVAICGLVTVAGLSLPAAERAGGPYARSPVPVRHTMTGSPHGDRPAHGPGGDQVGSPLKRDLDTLAERLHRIVELSSP